MRKKDILTCIKKYLPLIMRTAFACLFVFLTHSSKAEMMVFETCPKISSFEMDPNKIVTIVSEKIKAATFSNPETKKTKYRKKFHMGGDSCIRFKAEETLIHKFSNCFPDLPINYHTPTVATAVVLFLYRLASF